MLSDTANAATPTALPTLGVGLGFREPFLSDLFMNRSDVDFLEIVADHFFDPSPAKREELDLLVGNLPVRASEVLQGVGLETMGSTSNAADMAP